MEDVVATRGIPRETDWIEVYDGDHVLSIPCARMPNYTATIAATAPVEWSEDLESLLVRVRPLLSGRQLVVTLGDSNTASERSWPRRLARLRGDRLTDPVVINISNIDEVGHQGLRRLENLLAWDGIAAAHDVAVVYLGGLVDCTYPLSYLREFFNGSRADFALESERQLAGLPVGRRLASLLRGVPEESTFPRWIARRALVGARSLAEIASYAGHMMYAILQPLCYQDLVPSYADGIRQRYAAQAVPGISFDEWRRTQPKRVAIDVDERFAMPVRPTLEELRALWSATTDIEHAIFVDWAALFRDVPAAWYQASCDAVHYSDLGWQTLAGAVDVLLRARAPVMPQLRAE